MRYGEQESTYEFTQVSIWARSTPTDPSCGCAAFLLGNLGFGPSPWVPWVRQVTVDVPVLPISQK